LFCLKNRCLSGLTFLLISSILLVPLSLTSVKASAKSETNPVPSTANIMAIGSEIIAILGGWSAIVVAVVLFLNRNLSTKLSIKWQQKSQEQLEVLKGEISRAQAMNSNLLSAYSSGHQVSQQKRIEAIESTWEIILKKSGCFSVEFY
jgi:hypothetical protein